MTLSSRCSGVCCASACPVDDEPPAERKAAAATPPVVNTSRRENLFMGRHSLGGDESPQFWPVPSAAEVRHHRSGVGPSRVGLLGESLCRNEAGVIGQRGG